MKDLTPAEIRKIIECRSKTERGVFFSPSTGTERPWELRITGHNAEGQAFRKITSYKTEKAAIKALKEATDLNQRVMADFRERLESLV